MIRPGRRSPAARHRTSGTTSGAGSADSSRAHAGRIRPDLPGRTGQRQLLGRFESGDGCIRGWATEKMAGVADMRRRSPEPVPGRPEVQMRPGMASELLRELARSRRGRHRRRQHRRSDLDTLQQAMNRAIERQNMVRFTPVGQARERAAVTLRLAAEAIADGDTRLAAAILDQAQPESPDGSAATVAGFIGVALGLLDQWLPGHDRSTPADLGKLTRLPAGHWTGERAAADIVTLARKGRAFASLDALIARGRPARALRQRPCPRCRTPSLVATHHHPAARFGTHDHPLKPPRSQPCRTLRQIAPSRWID